MTKESAIAMAKDVTIPMGMYEAKTPFTAPPPTVSAVTMAETMNLRIMQGIVLMAMARVPTLEKYF